MVNIAGLQKEIEKQRSRLQTIETQYAAEQKKQFSALPRQVGLKTVDELIKALVPYASPRLKGRFNGNSVGNGRTKGTDTGVAGRKLKRPRITDEQRAAVKKLVRSGKTGAAVAEAVGISLPSVHNIKKALGLVKKK